MSRPSKRERAAALLDARPLRAPLRRLRLWRGVLVLNYHRIGDPSSRPWDRTLWSTTAEGLDEQLALLARETDVVGPADLPGLADLGRGRHVLLTFDDGYRDNYDLAFPLLRRHGLTAAFFLATGFLDSPRVAWWDEVAWMIRHAARDAIPAGPWLSEDVPLHAPDAESAIASILAAYKSLPTRDAEALLDHVAEGAGVRRCTPEDAVGAWMTWDMAREMRDGGMTIGGHTVSHPILAGLPVERQREEITTCARRLYEELGIAMTSFSYPVGGRGTFTVDTRRLLREQAVALAFSFYGGFARFDRWDPLDVPRIHVGPALDRQGLQATLRLPQLFAPSE